MEATALLTALTAYLGGLSWVVSAGIVVSREAIVASELESMEAPLLHLKAAGWRRLGKCGTSKLTQHLVDISLRQKLSATTNAVLDPDATLLEQLRNALEDWTNAAGRVVAVSAPVPIEEGPLIGPLIAAHRLTLDCEVLA